MNEPSCWIGIDPGLDGAIAFLWPESGAVAFRDMPTVEISVKPARRDYDEALIGDLLRQYPADSVVAIERQQVMPARGSDGVERSKGSFSHFRQGYGFGLLIGIASALKLPIEIVAPVSWKRGLMAGAPKDKGASILAASRLFPQASGDLRRKKDHARADALLIAEFARRRRLALVQ